MAKIYFLFGLFCVIMQSTHARNAPAARAATLTATSTIAPITFNDIVKQTDDAMKLMQTQFLSFWGVNSNDELTGLIQTQAKSFSDRVQNVVNGLTEEAKNGKTAEMVRGFTDRVTSQINDLKNKNPELFTEAQKYQESFQKGMKGIVEETQKFSEKLRDEGEDMNENVQKLVKQIYENTLETAHNVNTHVEAAVKKQ